MFVGAKFATILCLLTLRTAFFICTNYPTFRICNQPCIAFIYILYIFAAGWKKSPYHNWQRFFPTQPHGLRHFKFLQSYRLRRALDYLWALKFCLSILCSHADCDTAFCCYTAIGSSFQSYTVTLIVCLFATLLIFHWYLPPVLCFCLY